MTDFQPVDPQGNYVIISEEESNKLITSKLTAAGFRIYYSLKFYEMQKKKPKAGELMEKTKTSKSTFYNAIAQIKELNTLPLWVFNDLKTGAPVQIEKKLRDKIHARLGGHVDVLTTFGRVDLLTNVEIIQVRRVEDWKEALTEIQVYGSLFPQHSKRIHLFGCKERLTKIAAIKKSCAAFNINVTSEEV